MDPHVDPSDESDRPHRVLTEIDGAELASADLAILVVDHDAYDYQALAASGAPILDTRHDARLVGSPNVQSL